MPGRSRNDAASQPFGVCTETPMPLSSQTNSTGQGRCWYAVQAAALKPASAVAWFTAASPNEHTTRASSGTGRSTPQRPAMPWAMAAPAAFGRCEAMVEVCGGTLSATEPQTLWRPPAIGSSALAASDRAVSWTASTPATVRARSIMNAPER